MSKIIRLSEDMIGNKVRCVCKADWSYPEVGAIGTIVEYDKYDEDVSYMVQWPKGSTSGDDRWWAINKCIELVEGNMTNDQKIPEMTNKEIWEMLKPKMEKNGLKSTTSTIRLPAKWCYGDPLDIVKSYEENMVQNAIAIAYRSGYERAMKGRPFKFGEKKKKSGHWVPVDPDNLPKEGTRVRYSRECKDYSDSDEYICINDTGTVKLEGSWFGIALNNPHRYRWICFDDAENCLDMWVEDDK